MTLRLAQLDDADNKDLADKLQGPARDFYYEGNRDFQNVIMTYLSISSGKVDHGQTETDKAIAILNSMIGLGALAGGPVAPVVTGLLGVIAQPIAQNTLGGGSKDHPARIAETVGLESLSTVTRALFLNLIEGLSINNSEATSDQSWGELGKNLSYIARHYLADGRLIEFTKQINSNSQLKKDQKIGIYLSALVLKYLTDSKERETLSTDLSKSDPLKNALKTIKEKKLEIKDIPTVVNLKTVKSIQESIHKNPYFYVQANTDTLGFLAPFKPSKDQALARLYLKPYFLKFEEIPGTDHEFFIRDSDGHYLTAIDHSHLRFTTEQNYSIKFIESEDSKFNILVLKNSKPMGLLSEKAEYWGIYHLKLISQGEAEKNKKKLLKFTVQTLSEEMR